MKVDEERKDVFPIVVCGLNAEQADGLVIDDRVVLHNDHPSGILWTLPLVKSPQVTLEDALFWADCLAYLHDSPAFVRPAFEEFERYKYRYVNGGTQQGAVLTLVDEARDSVSYRPIKPFQPGTLEQTFFIRDYLHCLEMARESRHGPLTFVDFNQRHGDQLPLRDLYSVAARSIHLYAVGLRQMDHSSEYLCYYRAIESHTGNNGKRWIGESLRDLKSLTEDRIFVHHSEYPGADPVDAIAFYMFRAQERIDELLIKWRDPAGVAKYLYNTNRCGLAHGHHIVPVNFDSSYFELAADVCVVKLLARLAVEEAISVTRKA